MATRGELTTNASTFKLLETPKEDYSDLIANLEVNMEKAKKNEIRRRIFIKYLIYFFQIGVIVLFTRSISNPWLVVIVGMVLGFALSFGIKYLLQKIGFDKWISNVEDESKQSVIAQSVSEFSMMPDILKDQIDGLVFDVRDFIESKKRKSTSEFQDYMKKYLEAKRLIRVNDLCGAKKLLLELSDMIKKSKKYEILLEETQACLDPLDDVEIK